MRIAYAESNGKVEKSVDDPPSTPLRMTNADDTMIRSDVAVWRGKLFQSWLIVQLYVSDTKFDPTPGQTLEKFNEKAPQSLRAFSAV